MRQLKESVLDPGLDMPGLEYVSYDWMTWPVCKDIAERVYICNQEIYAKNVLPIIEKLKQEVTEDLESEELFGESFSKDTLKELTAAANHMYAHVKYYAIRNTKDMVSKIKMFNFINELLSLPCGKIIKNITEDEAYLHISTIKNDPKLKIILWEPENVSDRDKTQISKDIESVCKKHRVKYEENINSEGLWWTINLNR